MEKTKKRAVSKSWPPQVHAYNYDKAKINIEIREMPLGHSIELGDAYYRQTPEQCLNAYLKVVEDLTIIKRIDRQNTFTN
jgi:hypothetical protein